MIFSHSAQQQDEFVFETRFAELTRLNCFMFADLAKTPTKPR